MSELLFGLNKYEGNKFERLLSMIPDGEENAIAMSQLASFMGISERDVRKLIESARCAGNIIASTSGYFIPTTSSELRRYYNRAKSRIRTGAKELEPVRKVLKQLGEEGTDDQQSLFPE